jgi:serine/threonine protein phosphatase PrpC
MIVQIFSATDPGLLRSQNEDSIAFDAPLGLCILADGMGGHNAGEIASGMATAFIKSEMRNALVNVGKSAGPIEVRETIVQSINKANGAIFNMSRTNPLYNGMGTTLVIGVFRGDVLLLAHIGDSRCYRLRGDQMQQLTKDHSVWQEQVDSGLVATDHAMPRSPGQNLVTRALGVDGLVLADIDQFDLAPDDIYLLCSDGLSDMVSDDAIAAIVRADAPIEQKAQQLVAAANDGGGRDNISVMLVKVFAEPKSGLLGSARRAIKGVWPGAKRN